MNVKELTDAGFSIVAGQVDYGNTNCGFLTPTGAVLTPEGEAILAEYRADKLPQDGAEAKPKSRSKPKAKVEDEAPAAPPADDLDLGDLDKMLGE